MEQKIWNSRKTETDFFLRSFFMRLKREERDETH